MPIKLVVGLGNPGPRYEGTRHNIGRRVVQDLSGKLAGAHLLLPETYMNNSGFEVAKVAQKKGILPDEILVVLDEFQIPLGQMKILKSGSDGGHNGLKSIVACLGTETVPRLRIGIGPLPPGEDPAAYVLKRFSKTEEQKMDQEVPAIRQAVTVAVTEGLETAMNRYNNRPL